MLRDVTEQPSPALNRGNQSQIEAESFTVSVSVLWFIRKQNTRILEELSGIDCVKQFEGECAYLLREPFSSITDHLSLILGSLFG